MAGVVEVVIVVVVVVVVVVAAAADGGGGVGFGGGMGGAAHGGGFGGAGDGFPNRRRAERLLCVKSACDRLLHSEELFTRVTDSTPAWQGRRSLPLGLIVNADSMLVRNPASLGIENQRTKCVKMFRSNCINFSPTTIYHYAYSTMNAPNKGEVGGSSPPRPTIQITSNYAAILTFPFFADLAQKTVLSTVCQL